MKSAAMLVGLLMLVLGVLGVLVPDTFLLIGRRAATPVGLYVTALARVGIGLVLIQAAPASRAPLGLRVLGAMTFVAGLVTPLFGVERARAYLDWWAAQGPGVLRLWALVMVAFGVFVAYAVTDGHRAALRRARSAT